MKIEVKPGVYVVAVSGGVDSMTLLNMLSKIPKLRLVVAHFDHGIRSDSEVDRLLVQKVAASYQLPFVFDDGRLGPKASEANARAARYKFLNKVAKAAEADAIITAHHQDDLLETAIINLLRGTGRRGLSSLKSQPRLLRPLLQFSKAQILNYAHKNHLDWREDVTNQDTTYLRNYVRQQILPKFTTPQKEQLLHHINQLAVLNADIEKLSTDLLANQPDLDRNLFISLDHSVAKDIMVSWLKSQGVNEVSRKEIELLVRAAKTYAPGKQIDIDKSNILKVNTNKLALVHIER